MNSTVDSLCGAVENRTVFNFRGTALQLSKYLTVDGVDYHGTKCGAQVKSSLNSKFRPEHQPFSHIIKVVFYSNLPFGLKNVTL